MTGFKNFLLRGNLIELAVAFIMGGAFATVVTAFTAVITANLPAVQDTFKDAKSGDVGFFLNALIAFVLLSAVVYFFIVLPYTKAKDRWFPTAEPGTPADVQLLTEIRDLLAAQHGTTTPTSADTVGTPTSTGQTPPSGTI